ncbi:MAG TPA: entericidin A/B family lipoprotein [Phycisphaerales bacterium]|nr:entericidin A/B family lipoprotein [Phycisphaerales bacterium]
MNRLSIRTLVAGALAGAFVLLTLGAIGCETVKGVGKDVTNVGEAGERAISK